MDECFAENMDKYFSVKNFQEINIAYVFPIKKRKRNSPAPQRIAPQFPHPRPTFLQSKSQS